MWTRGETTYSQAEQTGVVRICGAALDDTGDVLAAAKELIGAGIELVVVSMGEKGALAVSGDEAWMAEPPRIDFVSAVGSGDAMVAALVDALLGGGGVPDALRAAVAAGAANAELYGAGFCTAESIKRLKDRVRLTWSG